MVAPMSPPNEPPFAPTTWVRRKTDASAVGQVFESRWNDQREDWVVQVQFGDGRRGVPASGLVAFDAHRRNLWQDLRDGALGSHRQFVTLMTHERLKHPPAAIGNALGSARARFYPYQFKPLLKFLDHPSHRVLVADDVGLGKTIEAGYILREWRARRDVSNVLVVVPARLRTKWQNELNTKFGESFETVDAGKVRSLLRRVADGAPLDPFSWIASYESLRDEQIVDLLTDLELPLDMVILDEAHRVRNVGTNQHKLARALAAGAEAAVFLTATPVQTKLEDLFRLLDLLDPGAYGSETTFSDILEANRPIVRAARLAAAGQFPDAVVELAQLGVSPHTVKLFGDPAFVDVLNRLMGMKDPAREDQIRLQQEISDFSLTGAIISRTRKSEVMVDRPIRKAQTPELPMSDAERAIYAAVAKFVRVIFPLASGWGQQMAALQFYRITASCIPAAADMMGRKLKGEGWRSLADAVLGDVDDEEEERQRTFTIQQVALMPEVERELLTALGRIPSREEDQKYLQLRKILREGWREDRAAGKPPRKIVVFANFRGTLLYLSRSLTEDGVQTRLIHGQVSIPDREARIAEFLDMREVNVLLSSEVGGEGLDLQAANTVVNYDLPWNPMVVEQRIGRVDRIGQNSPTIHIVSLVLQGTIEQRIVARLYDRIGLFEQTIGEIDQILGNKVEELVVEALSGNLTDAQMERRALDTADALHRQMTDLEQVNRRTDDLISADQALLDEVEQLQKRRRVPEPREIETLLLQFLEPRYPGIRLEGDAVRGVGTLELPPAVRRDFLEWARSVGSTEAQKWNGRLGAGILSLTFDAEVALRHSATRVEHVQARHPLVQFAVHRLTEEIKKQGETFAVRLRSTEVPEGTWAVGVWALDVRGTRRERRLGVVAADVGGTRVLVGDEAEDLLVQALATGEELDPRPALDADDLAAVADRLKDTMADNAGLLVRKGKEAEGRRLARRRATWSNTLQRHVDRQRELLERLRREGKREAILKMHAGKLQKMDAELRAKVAELSADPEFDIEDQEICALLIVNSLAEEAREP